MQRHRAWQGAAVLSFGFRPFFLLGALWAALAMALWVPMLAGKLTLPTAFDPVSWHAHEFLFGFLSAVIAGFLLTAVPNWTGRLPVTGWPLAMLAALWLAGRIAVLLSQTLPPVVTACADLAMIAALAVLLGREIVAGRNWRNLPVVGLLAVFGGANGLFHAEAAADAYAAQGMGLRLGLAAAVMMIALIGGRIVPSFTRNWLAKRGEGRLPTPMQSFDTISLAILLAALLAWVVWPFAMLTGAALALGGMVHLVRMARWVALALWAAGHAFANGTLAHVIMFAAFAAFAALGGRIVDRRRQCEMGAAWHKLRRATRRPGIGSLLTAHPLRLAAGTALYAALIFVHPLLFGVSPIV